MYTQQPQQSWNYKMKNQRTITDVGIDLDGVVYPFSKAFKKYCAEVLGRTDFPEPTKWDFYEDWGISTQEFNEMLRKAPVSHRLFATEYPMEHVRQGWDMLRESGFRLHVITARPSTAWAQTSEWLHDNDLIPDHLHFTHDKTVLSHVAKNESAMIDDHVDYYIQLERSGVFAVLQNQPWNKYYQGAFRAESLVDFATIVNKVNNREIPWLQPSVNKYYLTQ